MKVETARQIARVDSVLYQRRQLRSTIVAANELVLAVPSGRDDAFTRDYDRTRYTLDDQQSLKAHVLRLIDEEIVELEEQLASLGVEAPDVDA
mgnify:CR=1 FL=1